MDRDVAPRRPDIPTPGFFRVRLVKGGPWIPARIVHNEGRWLVLLEGLPTSKASMSDPWSVPRMEWVAFSPMISEAEYLELLQTRRGAVGAHPYADPNAPIDWRYGKPIF